MKNAIPEREAFSEGFFLNRNVIKVFGEINDSMANTVVSALLYLDFLFKSEKVPRERREINMWINSPGGSVTAGFAIFDAMNFVDCDIRTTCIGMAASMAAFLLSSGTHGKREALPNSTILIHQPLGGASGQTSDILLYAEQIRQTREQLNRIMAANTGRSFEQICVDTDRDNRMTAEEGREYGLIDRVVTGIPKTSAATMKGA